MASGFFLQYQACGYARINFLCFSLFNIFFSGWLLRADKICWAAAYGAEDSRLTVVKQIGLK